jgi:hypothetical protein
MYSIWFSIPLAYLQLGIMLSVLWYCIVPLRIRLDAC